jgi:hypothetical protein
MDNHPIDKWAREEIIERDIKPRPSVWDQIDSRLDGEKPSTDKDKTDNRKRWVTGLVLLGLAGVLVSVLRFYQPSQKIQQEAQNLEIPMNTPEKQPAKTSEIIHQGAESQEEKGQIQPYSPMPAETKPIHLIQKTSKLFKGSDIPGEKSKEPIKSDAKTEMKEPVFAAQQENQEVTGQTIVQATSTVPQYTMPGISQKNRFDATKLLEEVNADMAGNHKKHRIDPNALLREAEKESNERFLHKIVKTVTETSTTVYAAVASRNVEP